MKRVMRNKKMMAVVFAAAMGMGISNAALAGEKKSYELMFIGSSQEQPLLQLRLNNLDNAEYTIIIKDAYGTILLTEKLSGEKISRRYKLDAEESEIAGTTFEIKNSKTNETAVYSINNNIKVVRDFAVTESVKTGSIPNSNTDKLLLTTCDAYSIPVKRPFKF
jgi:hypothetical protein